MARKKQGGIMIQWIGVIFTLVGLLYTGVKDYQKGDIKIPQIQKPLTAVKHPIQYCLMAYDPNIDKVFYLHENGLWYDFAPQQRRYSTTTTQHHQGKSQEALGTAYGSQGTQGYRYGQSSQAYANPPRY
jgi:hypothetical protein